MFGRAETYGGASGCTIEHAAGGSVQNEGWVSSFLRILAVRSPPPQWAHPLPGLTEREIAGFRAHGNI